MSITKKINKKMLGGSARTTLNKDANSINQDFADSFKYYFQELKVRMDYNVSDEEDLIFIGLIDKDTLFGTTVKQSTGGIVKYIHLKTALYINFKDDNVKRINQFKLYIMSIMANYPLQGGNSLYTKITPLLNPLKISEIMKILDIPEDIKASLPVKPPPLQNYDLLTLNIYREFGVKCTLDGGECHGKIKDDFINKNQPLTREPIIEGYIRDLYVNVFDYITGSEMPIKLVMNRKQAIQKSINNIEKAISYIYDKMNNSLTFIGARTSVKFEFKTLLQIFNIIRKDVNNSIFNQQVQPEKLDEKVPANKSSV
jgi:hypothetical protein